MAHTPHTKAPAASSERPTNRLGGGDIGRCLTRLHHDRFTETAFLEDAVRDRNIARGVAHERDITSHLEDTQRGVVDLSHIPWWERTGATESAMDEGASLILGGRLESPDRTLVGMPDLLINDGSGYLPIDVKGHKVMGTSGIEATYAPLDDLLDANAETIRFRSGRRRDLLQVAHYRHLLLGMDLASTRPLGGVIGTDEPLGCAWVDLDSGARSVMDEHESFVAEAEEALAWGSDHGHPLVEPWKKKECETCPWKPLCMGELESADDPTLLRTVTAETRDDLRAIGITTVAEVADLDLDSEVVDHGVILQARARTAGTLLRRDDGMVALPLPHAPVEVDLDLETYGETTYLAGLLVTDDKGSRYEPLADWTSTSVGEQRLLEQLFERFSEWTRPDVIVYHWTGFEIDRLEAGARIYGLDVPGWDSIRSWFEANAVDLCDWTRDHLVSPNGHGLKVIAPMCGFNWRDDDPGGLQSEIWFEELMAGNADMRDRLLAYNEDDVIAQLRVREFIRAADSGLGQGSALASITDWRVQ